MTSVDPRIRGLALQLDVNTRTFARCVAGVAEDDAGRRVAPEHGTLREITCHLVDARAYLARLVGCDVDSPLLQRLAAVRSVADLEPAPTLADAHEAWNVVSPPLAERMAALTADDLDREVDQAFPVGDNTVLGAAAFLLHHESYHLGQLGLLRRQLGLPAASA